MSNSVSYQDDADCSSDNLCNFIHVHEQMKGVSPLPNETEGFWSSQACAYNRNVAYLDNCLSSLSKFGHQLC